ncbi:hypothetical protein FJZ53_00760 [Candidatus Woesearchaeota archaeon]|nr:hypothetical protein [Candidatus Woesearchaeota archaeon]
MMIMVYIISIFYRLYFLIAGFNFLIAGFDVGKKETAKQWLKNTLLMIFFVQASYFFYKLILEVASLLSAGVINMIPEDFFLITIDNLVNLGLEMSFGLVYLSVLLTTDVLLGLRYLIVSAGVMLFPIGLFLYFTLPLRTYGKLILNVLMVAIFLPFIQSLMLLCASMILQIPIFQNFKILVMISAFTLLNLTMFFLIIFAIIKSAFAVLNSDMGRAAKTAAKYLA